MKQEDFSKKIKISREVKSGLKEFFKVKHYVMNLIINIFLWYIIITNYQIIGAYENFFPGD
jgi:hypothetical protein